MSLFRKQASSTVAPTPDVPEPPAAAPTAPVVATTAPQPLFTGPVVDLHAIYTAAKVSAEERDRVVRAEQLLGILPSTAAQTREVVDATLRAFGVDARKIIDAASKEYSALEAFIRMSQEQTQKVADDGRQRIAELEAEIARCRQVGAQAAREGEERARSINTEMTKVQRVLEFFGHEIAADDIVESMIDS